MKIKINELTKIEPADAEDYIKLAESNRTRVRTLAGMIVSVCGMLLSGSFVILFFILKEQRSTIPTIVPVTLFATTGFLLVSVMMSVLAACPPSAISVYTRLEMVDALLNRYTSEYTKAVFSVVFLFVGMLSFILALALFAWSGLRT